MIRHVAVLLDGLNIGGINIDSWQPGAGGHSAGWYLGDVAGLNAGDVGYVHQTGLHGDPTDDRGRLTVYFDRMGFCPLLPGAGNQAASAGVGALRDDGKPVCVTDREDCNAACAFRFVFGTVAKVCFGRDIAD